ncbi:excinuclease ABC subunit C [Pontibacter anaerobius]|uniref:Excinuclease ABC subunit C n=1 Tax=Pontibacter anaerobius TaxID=2993940 RepID=A0ABT3RKB0_9BACT|nr:excinuclease ABC subunit C [Pontibacter anaerobius]MCX2741891.1 excinuclease ABC subunit C [Pontibacter anaerobius]
MQAQEPHFFVYIFGDQPRENVEIGVAGNLQQLSHSKNTPAPDVSPGQPAKLVYYEHYKVQDEALTREQQLKGESRDATIHLIESMNPNWLDLSDTLDD